MGRYKKEIWKFIDIPGVKKNYYKISSWGNIINIKGKKMKYETDKDGYQRCTLTMENGKKKHFTDRLYGNRKVNGIRTVKKDAGYERD